MTIYVIHANAGFTECGMTSVQQFVRQKELNRDQYVVEIFEADPYDDNADARAHYQAWIEKRQNLAPSVKAELAKERDRVEREIVAWLRDIADDWIDSTQEVRPSITVRNIADRIEHLGHREAPPEEGRFR